MIGEITSSLMASKNERLHTLGLIIFKYKFSGKYMPINKKSYSYLLNKLVTGEIA